ncbi:MAG: hypothetical protein L0Y35_04470 [Flammeovirgaceae bacterium]|nr:hypothetical protein [Flammeovirgaceae bacterium]
MKRFLVFVIVGLILASPVLAQNYAFKVMINEGKTEVKTGGMWQTVRVGGSLLSDDELKVPANGYLALNHYSGKVLEVKQAGQYKVADLSAKVTNTADKGIMNKYTDFVLSKQTEKTNKLSATGAVHRGSPDDIIVFMPEKSQVFNDVINVSWDSEKITGPYTVFIVNLFGDELKRMETTEKSIQLNLNDFAYEKNLLVRVSSKSASKTSKDYAVSKLTGNEKVKHTETYNQIKDQVNEATAINYLIKASFFEQNGLLVDAATAHQEAVKLAPGVTAYQEAYLNFLYRNGLKEFKEKK